MVSADAPRMLLAMAVLLLSACSERIERHRMTWKYVEPADPRILPSREIELHYVEAPECWVWFLSRDLGSKLEALNRRELAVDLRVRRIFGRVKGFRVERIESIDRWDRPRSGNAVRGQVRCPPR